MVWFSHDTYLIFILSKDSKKIISRWSLDYHKVIITYQHLFVCLFVCCLFVTTHKIISNLPDGGDLTYCTRGVYRDLTRESNHTWIPREKGGPYYKEVCIRISQGNQTILGSLVRRGGPYYKEVCIGISRGNQTIPVSLVRRGDHITKRCV